MSVQYCEHNYPLNSSCPECENKEIRENNQHRSIVSMIERMATRGLVPCEHNLAIFQCADCSDGKVWGAAIGAAFRKYEVTAHGATLTEALENLMLLTNRGADVQHTTPNPQPTDGQKKTS